MRITSKLRCSFCKKRDAEVGKLVAGPRVYICDECVAVASRLMSGPPAPPLPRRQSLSERLSSYVRRFFGSEMRASQLSQPS